MAKFRISFVPGNREDEEVTASHYVDNPPFVDFRTFLDGDDVTVARYRAEDIQRIIREP